MSYFKYQKRAVPALALLTCSTAIWANTLTVGQPNTPCPNPQYSTITDALNAASAGDVIEICPALYNEQITLTKPVSLIGVPQQDVGRVLIQPATLTADSQGYMAVISVENTSGVTISNLAIDASKNTVATCTPILSGIHFYNSSGIVDGVAISGTQLSTQTNCTTLFPGNGFGIEADQTSGSTGPFSMTVRDSSIQNFGRNAIFVAGSGEQVHLTGNSISGVGPSTGVNQFGIFLADGVTGDVTSNYITQGNCGTLAPANCHMLRSEGIVLRSTGQGVIASGNVISHVQVAFYINGLTDNVPVENAVISNNVISDVDGGDGMELYAVISSVFSGNRMFRMGPISAASASNEGGCGINDSSGTGSSANTISGNFISDSYCGIAFVSADQLGSNTTRNVLYQAINADNFPNAFPTPAEPGQPAPAVVADAAARRVQ